MRPASDSAAQERYLARWYETFLDACKAAKRRNMGIVCHPKHKAAMMDMIERVSEDPLWGMGDPPPLVFYTKAPQDSFQLIDLDTMKLLTMTEAMKSRRGLGRYAHILSPDAALREDR